MRSWMAVALASHSSAVATMRSEAAMTPATTRLPGWSLMLLKPRPMRRSSGMARNSMRPTQLISQSLSTSRSTHLNRPFFSSASR